MNFRQAYLGMINAYPGGWDAMAAALGLSKDALENRVYERKGQSVSVHQALQMQIFSDTTFFADATARATNGVFTKLLSEPEIGVEELQRKFHKNYIEFGEFSRQYIAYTEDNNIDNGERAKLEARAYQIHKNLHELKTLIFQIFCKKSDVEVVE